MFPLELTLKWKEANPETSAWHSPADWIKCSTRWSICYSAQEGLIADTSKALYSEASSLTRYTFTYNVVAIKKKYDSSSLLSGHNNLFPSCMRDLPSQDLPKFYAITGSGSIPWPRSRYRWGSLDTMMWIELLEDLSTWLEDLWTKEQVVCLPYPTSSGSAGIGWLIEILTFKWEAMGDIKQSLVHRYSESSWANVGKFCQFHY